MKVIIIVAGCLAVFLAGFGAGRLGTQGPATVGDSGAERGGAGTMDDGGRAGGSGSAFGTGSGGGGSESTGAGRKGRGGGRVSSIDELVEMMNPVDWVESSIRMRDALAGVSSAGLKGLLEEIKRNPQAMQQQWMLYGAIGKAWAERDLEGALEFGLDDANRLMLQTFMPAVVLELSKSDPERAEKLIMEIPNRDIRMNLMNQLASVMVEHSPEKAIRLVMQSGGQNGSWMMNNIYQRWAAHDLEAAKAYLPKITNSQDRQGAVQAVAQNMAVDDLEGALAWVETLGSSKDRATALQAVTTQLATLDVHKALELIESMPANAQRSEVMGGVMQTWMHTDREAAMAWLETIDNPFEKNRILSNISWQLGASDPVQTIDMALEMKSKNQAMNLLNSAMQSLPEAEITKTAAKIEGMSEGQVKESAMAHLVDRWSRSDPVAAMKFATELPSGRDYDNAVRTAARMWAGEDGPAAAKWVLGIGDEERRKTAMVGVIGSWSDREPEAAARFLAGVSDPKLADGMVSQLASNWGQRDPDAALAWAGGLDGEARGKAIGKVVGSIAGHDPQTAMAMFDRGLVDEMGEAEAKQAASTIASNLGQWDSELAVKWAAGLPEGIRSDAVGNAIRQWVQNSPMAVSEWLVGVPAGEMKDAATGRLVESIERTDPESAFVWAASVGDDDQRLELITRVARRWGKEDGAAAMEAVLATDLSDEQKAKILKRFE